MNLGYSALLHKQMQCFKISKGILLPDSNLTKKRESLPALWAAAVGNNHILDGLSERKHRDPEETNRSSHVQTGHRCSFEPAHFCAGRVYACKQTQLGWKLAST